jgi:hypothetical protein
MYLLIYKFIFIFIFISLNIYIYFYTYIFIAIYSYIHILILLFIYAYTYSSLGIFIFTYLCSCTYMFALLLYFSSAYLYFIFLILWSFCHFTLLYTSVFIHFYCNLRHLTQPCLPSSSHPLRRSWCFLCDPDPGPRVPGMSPSVGVTPSPASRAFGVWQPRSFALLWRWEAPSLRRLSSPGSRASGHLCCCPRHPLPVFGSSWGYSPV